MSICYRISLIQRYVRCHPHIAGLVLVIGLKHGAAIAWIGAGAQFALGNIGRPLLCERIRIDQVLGIELVEPFHALAPAFCGSCADDLLVVVDHNVTAGIRIAIAFSETIAENGAVLIAAADDAGHRNDVTINIEFLLQRVGIVAESDQDLLELISCLGHFESEEIEPCNVDERHIADGLDGGLSDTELLDPRQRPDMAVLVRAHVAVLRSLFEDLAKIRHVFVNVILKRDDHALLSILENIRVTKSCRRDELRQGLDVGHLKRDLIAPLVALDTLPVDVDICLLLKALVDSTFVGVSFRAGRISGQTGDFCLFRQWECQ